MADCAVYIMYRGSVRMWSPGTDRAIRAYMPS